MVELLAIIGILVIIFWVSKFLKRLGQICEDVASNFLEKPKSINIEEYRIKSIPQQTDLYIQKVRKEIDQITGV